MTDVIADQSLGDEDETPASGRYDAVGYVEMPGWIGDGMTAYLSTYLLQLGRLQVAGTCHFSSGFSNCKVDHFSRPRR